MIKLEKIKSNRIMFDTNVLMCGAERPEAEYSFDCMRECYLDHIFSYFEDIILHEAVFYELTENRKEYFGKFIGKNLTIVEEGDLYNHNLTYNSIFNAIAKYDLFDYERSGIAFKDNPSKNRGEVFSLAYAAYHGIPFFSSRDGSANSAVIELKELRKINLVGFEYCLLVGYLNNSESPTIKKRIKSLYKTYCAPEIKRGLIPDTFPEFFTKYSKQ